MAILSYFTRFIMKRENAGSWDSGWNRSKYWKPILHSSKTPETPRKSFLELIRIIERRKYQRGPTPWPGGWGVPPLLGAPPVSWIGCGPPGLFLLLINSYKIEKVVSWSFRIFGVVQNRFPIFSPFPAESQLPAFSLFIINLVK